MSLLIKSVKPNCVLNVYKVRVALGSRSAHFYPDYKPGPVPKTEEERIAAAKKYNLLPEEYESYEEGEGYGDYPKLPFESVDSRDDWYPWDNPELRKNFNEPVNIRMMNCLPEFGTTKEPKIPHWKGSLYFLSLSGICLTSMYLLKLYLRVLEPVTEKQLPTAGVTHYTFELDYSAVKMPCETITVKKINNKNS